MHVEPADSDSRQPTGLAILQLSQALGYTVTSREPYCTLGCTLPADCVFPNAQIPQSAWAAPAKNLLQYIPDPNDGAYFTTSAYPDALRDDKWSGRIDANTGVGMISGYYFCTVGTGSYYGGLGMKSGIWTASIRVGEL